jgi:hypothetical protein
MDQVRFELHFTLDAETQGYVAAGLDVPDAAPFIIKGLWIVMQGSLRNQGRTDRESPGAAWRLRRGIFSDTFLGCRSSEKVRCRKPLCAKRG